MTMKISLISVVNYLTKYKKSSKQQINRRKVIPNKNLPKFSFSLEKICSQQTKR